jgi:DNA-binding transcriptional MerR regulator
MEQAASYTPSFLLTASVARLCGVTPATVRFWERTGRLPAVRTEDGVRLFTREGVDRLMQDRKGSARVDRA